MGNATLPYQEPYVRTFLDDPIVPLDNNLFPWSEKIPEDCRLKKFEWLTHAACKGGIFFVHACGLSFTFQRQTNQPIVNGKPPTSFS